MITLNFEPNLEHQTHAINAVVDLFNGQPTNVNNAIDGFSLTQPLYAINNVNTDKNQDNTSQRIASQTIIIDKAFSDYANKANIVLQFEDAGLVVGCV